MELRKNEETRTPREQQHKPERRETKFAKNSKRIGVRHRKLRKIFAIIIFLQRKFLPELARPNWGAILDSWPCCKDVEEGKKNWFGHSIKPETLDLGYPHCLPNGKYAPHQCVDKDEFSLLDLFIGDRGCFCVTEYGKLQPEQSDFDPNCNPYPEKAWPQKRIQNNAVKNYLVATIKKEIPANNASLETNRPY